MAKKQNILEILSNAGIDISDADLLCNINSELVAHIKATRSLKSSMAMSSLAEGQWVGVKFNDGYKYLLRIVKLARTKVTAAYVDENGRAEFWSFKASQVSDIFEGVESAENLDKFIKEHEVYTSGLAMKEIIRITEKGSNMFYG